MLTYLLVFLLTVVASFIQRVSGFGFGIFVMMFFPFFLPSYGESVMLSGLLAGSTALMIAVKNWKYIRWQTMGRVVFFNVLFSFLATEYMRSMSNNSLKQCLGVMLILIALYFLFLSTISANKYVIIRKNPRFFPNLYFSSNHS